LSLEVAANRSGDFSDEFGPNGPIGLGKLSFGLEAVAEELGEGGSGVDGLDNDGCHFCGGGVD
jgi:hypothetical protein